MCEECDAIWLDRDTTVPPLFPRQPDIPCVECGHSLRSEESHWANLPELLRLTWPNKPVHPAEASGGIDGAKESGQTSHPEEEIE